MINVLKSKTRNGAILNAVYHACDDYPGADFLHSKSAPDRSQISQMCFSLQSPPASPLSFFFYFFSFISKSTTLVLRVPFSSPGSIITSIITSSSRVTPIVPLSLASIMHSLSLSLFLFFFFFLLPFSFLCFVRVTIQYLFTRYTCTNCKTAPLGLWRITVSRSIYDSDCSQSAIV